MKKDELINKTKNLVAEQYGFADGILGTRWEFGMQITHRRKKQLNMYEDVISLLAEALIDAKNNSPVSPNERKGV